MTQQPSKFLLRATLHAQAIHITVQEVSNAIVHHVVRGPPHA